MKRQKPPNPGAETAIAALEQPDRFLHETVASARASVDRCLIDAAEYARSQPEKALLSALAAGYVLRMLPVAGILGLVIRLALRLLKPATLLYGGARLWQNVRNDASPRTENAHAGP